ncbi:uncharacterized protein BO80DRAFT_412219 [Aspergillus ibericus CBS 121593]|uniref:Uncharacterized protein n=1 Tax=Aspergillus ibericus CBS 121593 TaxID=1448316 RepID=A0A395GSV5_9EURO|nr:hypothetical protein BO80DRAFT_412219 [Aspergillus ibericus CBS 121593]RAK98671.1 hypothetical protein BO80DRAFT_412219 [Aspergillus ibericus CBS 121593]
MPTPVAKGIIITVSALVAAGIAVYESPQFRQWVNNSRRKLALALHHLGDEINPRDAAAFRQDISMTEEVGAAAEERRRLAVEELQRRRSLLEARRKARGGTPASSFDALVDDSGRLLDSPEPHANDSMANSTAVEVTTSQPVQRGKQTGNSTPLIETDSLNNIGNRLQIAIPQPGSHAPSLVEFTPTSEAPDKLAASMHSQPEEGERPVEWGGYHRPGSAASSHTEEYSQIIYAYPDGHAVNDTSRDLRSPFSDLSDLDSEGHPDQRPSTPSTAGSFSQIYESAVDGSEGTLSDFERSGAATPASWSEIGSVISNEEPHHM